MQSNKPFSRRVYFIRDSSQPHLIMGIQVIYLLLVFFSSIVFYIVVNYNLAGDLARPLNGHDTLDLLLPTLIFLNAIGLIAASVISIFFTHRIIGPVYRLRQIMRDVGDGNLSQFAQFRKDDELQELAVGFDEMIVGLNRRVYNLRSRADAILKASSSVALGSQVTGLSHEANQLVADLARFRLLPKPDLDAWD
jgi:methyl-accepting chemotaxis protein